MGNLFDIVFIANEPFIVVSSDKKQELMGLRNFIEQTRVVMIDGEPLTVKQYVDREYDAVLKAWKEKHDNA